MITSLSMELFFGCDNISTCSFILKQYWIPKVSINHLPLSLALSVCLSVYLSLSLPLPLSLSLSLYLSRSRSLSLHLYIYTYICNMFLFVNSEIIHSPHLSNPEWLNLWLVQANNKTQTRKLCLHFDWLLLLRMFKSCNSISATKLVSVVCIQ